MAHDTFWTWRETMYRFALAMTPDDVEAVATLLYVEMLEQGFTRVGEFHYLHHDRDGSPYADLAEMAERIARRGRTRGIGLTLLPTFYAHGAFGGAAPHAGQRRFICYRRSVRHADGAPRARRCAALPGRECRHRAAQSARGGAGRTRSDPSARRGRADAHPRRRADEGSRGLPGLVGQPAGRNGCSSMRRSIDAGASSTPPT